MKSSRKASHKIKRFAAIALPVLSAFATMGTAIISCDPPGGIPIHDFKADAGSVFVPGQGSTGTLIGDTLVILACRTTNSCQTSGSQPRPLQTYYPEIPITVVGNTKTVEVGWYRNPDNRSVEAFFPSSIEPLKRQVWYDLANSGTHTLGVNSRGIVINSVRQNDQDPSGGWLDSGQDFFAVRIQTVDAWPQSTISLSFKYDWIGRNLE